MKLRTALLSLIALSVFSTTQANLFEHQDILFPDRIVQLENEKDYQQVDNELQLDEKSITNEFNSAKRNMQESKKGFCEIMDYKLERLALASANLKYNSAYINFQILRHEIESEMQSNQTIGITCYTKDTIYSGVK